MGGKKPVNQGKKGDKKLKDIAKQAEDKTFGMKNKNKSKQVQKVMKGIAAKNKGGIEKLESDIYESRKRKQLMEENKKLMVDVFAKNVSKTGGGNICQFFKAGLCNKGRKCKFSHDVTKTEEVVKVVEEEKEDTRTMKIDLFVDQRQLIFGHHKQNMSEKELSEMVNFNAHKYLNANKTEKICKNFLEAVEGNKYGWNWLCKNGHECIFKHCLPEGYILKSQQNNEPLNKEDPNKILQEVDNTREKLDKENLKLITFDQFMKWKNKRMESIFKARNDRTKEELKKLGIKKKKIVTGIEYFKQNEGKIEDAEEGVFDSYKKENTDVQIDENAFNDDDEELPDDL